MSAILYLWATGVKNNLKALLKSPGRLILVLFMAALLVMLFFTSGSSAVPMPTGAREQLYALALLFYAVIFLIGSFRGFASGASFFSMADVNLLFAAPISQRRILLYGLVRQMGVALFMALMLFYQYGWLHNSFGISMGDMVVLLLGYGASVFCSQLTAMVIYSLTSCSERARRWLRWGIYLLCVWAVGYLALGALAQPEDMLGGAVAAANTVWLRLFPVAGWLGAAVAGALQGALLPLVLGVVACGLYAAALLWLLNRVHADFYEDVLQAAEVSLSAVTARKEGRVEDAPPQKIKLGNTGIGRGEGSGVFLYKHLLEDRRSRFLLLDRVSLLFAAITIGFAFFTRDAGPVPTLCFSVYLMLFSMASGRWVREMLLPYIYLIPEPSFLKLVGLMRESVLRAVLESVVIFVPAGLILGLGPVGILACILARFGFSLLLMAGNVLIERVLGSLQSKTLILLVYFLILFLLCIPGVVLGVLGGVLLTASGLPSHLSTAAAIALTLPWNLLVSAVILFFCRDMLDCAELNNR